MHVLPGVQVVTEVSGMSNFKWMMTQAMSLSLYHFLVTEPAPSQANSSIFDVSKREDE